RRRIIALQQRGEADELLRFQDMAGRWRGMARHRREAGPARPLRWFVGRRAGAPGAQLVAHQIAIAQRASAGQGLGHDLLAHAAGGGALAPLLARRRAGWSRREARSGAGGVAALVDLPAAVEAAR